eukprot:2408697-Prymnesium_polylepis.2
MAEHTQDKNTLGRTCEAHTSKRLVISASERSLIDAAEHRLEQRSSPPERLSDCTSPPERLSDCTSPPERLSDCTSAPFCEPSESPPSIPPIGSDSDEPRTPLRLPPLQRLIAREPRRNCSADTDIDVRLRADAATREHRLENLRANAESASMGWMWTPCPRRWCVDERVARSHSAVSSSSSSICSFMRAPEKRSQG